MKKVIIIGDIPDSENMSEAMERYFRVEQALFASGYCPINPLRWFLFGYTPQEVKISRDIEMQYCNSVCIIDPLSKEDTAQITLLRLTVISKLNYDVKKEVIAAR
jgi:hypothetical protein